jgi:hypothetical protein
MCMIWLLLLMLLMRLLPFLYWRRQLDSIPKKQHLSLPVLLQPATGFLRGSLHRPVSLLRFF